MKRITFTVATALILGALTFALPKLRSNVQAKPVAGPAAPQIGGDACRRVKFKFTNNRTDSTKIRFVQIHYFNKSRNSWYDENVHLDNNADCPLGNTCTTTGDNLPDAQGMDITKVRLRYQYFPKTKGANWSDEILSAEFTPASPSCGDDKIYGTGQGWKIQ